MVDTDLTSPERDPIALATAAALATAVTVFSLFTDWLAREVPIPLGVLLFLFVLVILPTGELIGVMIAVLNATKREYKRGVRPSQRSASDTTDRDDDAEQ